MGSCLLCNHTLGIECNIMVRWYVLYNDRILGTSPVWDIHQSTFKKSPTLQGRRFQDKWTPWNACLYSHFILHFFKKLAPLFLHPADKGGQEHLFQSVGELHYWSDSLEQQGQGKKVLPQHRWQCMETLEQMDIPKVWKMLPTSTFNKAWIGWIKREWKWVKENDSDTVVTWDPVSKRDSHSMPSIETETMQSWPIRPVTRTHL